MRDAEMRDADLIMDPNMLLLFAGSGDDLQTILRKEE